MHRATESAASATRADGTEKPALVSSDVVDVVVDDVDDVVDRRRATLDAEELDADVERGAAHSSGAASDARARWSFAIGFSHGVASPSGMSRDGAAMAVRLQGALLSHRVVNHL